MIDENTYHYYFYFKDIADPIIIESTNKKTALNLLDLKIKQQIKYQKSNLVNVTLHSLVTGVTTKNIDGENYVWMKELGWLSETDYNQLKTIKNDKK